MFFFSENYKVDIEPYSVEGGYQAILQGDLNLALARFEAIESPRARWAKTLVEILLGYLENYPTYFEIRNFLEIDLDFLLKNNKIEYVEMLLGSLDVLININQETYKYVARVMFENQLYNVTLSYLNKSLDIYYKDPELHFLFAKYYINSRDYIKAYEHIRESEIILPDYYPIKVLKEKILKYVS